MSAGREHYARTLRSLADAIDKDRVRVLVVVALRDDGTLDRFVSADASAGQVMFVAGVVARGTAALVDAAVEAEARGPAVLS